MHYLTLMIRDGNGWDFIIPDIAGFAAHADVADVAEALAVAREVLTQHLTALSDNGKPLPVARDPGAVLADPEFAEEVADATTTILLPAIIAGGRAQRVNLSLDEWTLNLIDSAARDRGLTRSAFMAEACRRYAASGLASVIRSAEAMPVFEPMVGQHHGCLITDAMVKDADAGGGWQVKGDGARVVFYDTKAEAIEAGRYYPHGSFLPGTMMGYAVARDAGSGQFIATPSKGRKAPKAKA